MILPALSIGAVVLLCLTATAILLSQDWRISLAALIIQAGGVAFLVGLQWPVGMALIKLLVGCMAAAVLGLTQSGRLKEAEDVHLPSGYIFRLLAAGLVIVLVLSVSSKILLWLPGVGLHQIQGSLVLIAVGLLQLGMTTRPLRIILGLLTVLAGFEIIYAGVEVSVLVAGLLAGVNLGLAFFGAYLLSLTPPQVTP